MGRQLAAGGARVHRGEGRLVVGCASEYFTGATCLAPMIDMPPSLPRAWRRTGCSAVGPVKTSSWPSCWCVTLLSIRGHWCWCSMTCLGRRRHAHDLLHLGQIAFAGAARIAEVLAWRAPARRADAPAARSGARRHQRSCRAAPAVAAASAAPWRSLAAQIQAVRPRACSETRRQQSLLRDRTAGRPTGLAGWPAGVNHPGCPAVARGRLGQQRASCWSGWRSRPWRWSWTCCAAAARPGPAALDISGFGAVAGEAAALCARAGAAGGGGAVAGVASDVLALRCLTPQ